MEVNFFNKASKKNLKFWVFQSLFLNNFLALKKGFSNHYLSITPPTFFIYFFSFNSIDILPPAAATAPTSGGCQSSKQHRKRVQADNVVLDAGGWSGAQHWYVVYLDITLASDIDFLTKKIF